MRYTVWMDGTRIGETAFELRHGGDRRGGVFHPTEPGLLVLPGITAMGPALLDAGRMCRENGIDTEDPDLDFETVAQEVFGTGEGRHVLEAAKLIARLELRDERGESVRWDSILITDLNDLPGAVGSSAEVPAAMGGGHQRPVRYFISAKFSVEGWATRLRSRAFRVS